MRSTAAALAAGLLLAACATAPTTHLSEGKALADAWSTFDATAVTLDSLATAGVLTPAEKATIKADAPRIHDALKAATDAYDAGSDATAQQNVTLATSLIAQLVTIAGVHK